MFKKAIGRICPESFCENHKKMENVNQLLCDKCGKRLEKVFVTDPFRIMGVGAIILALLVSAIYSSNNTSTTSTNRDVLFVMQGSNTIGSELAPALAEAYLKKIGGKDIKVITSDKDTLEKHVQVVLPGNENPQKIIISSHGSANAFKGLEKGTCEIGMASRKITAQEIEQLKAKKLGDLSLPGSANIIAVDGLAVVVNSSQNITKLPKEDIAKIFTGAITDWASVGGKSGPINVYSREKTSGTYDTFSRLMLNNQQVMEAAKKYEDSAALSRDIAQDPSGIGFIGMSYVGTTRAVAVFNENDDAILPSQLTISNAEYPLSRNLFMYISPTSQNKHAKAFIEFCLSSEGQAIVQKTGFISPNIEITKVAEPSSRWINREKKQQYQNLVANSQAKLSLSIKFQAQSALLEDKAFNDIDRLIQFLSIPPNQNYKITLVGFTDTSGSYEANILLAEQRSTAIRDQIAAKNKDLANRIGIVGFGQEEPVASNNTFDGREKNRRVEIWIQK